MQKTIHTLLAFGLVAGALLTVIGMMLSPVMLRLMDTPETVLPNSISYFRTYFTGSLGLCALQHLHGYPAGGRRQPPSAAIPDYFLHRQHRARLAVRRRIPHGRGIGGGGDGHFAAGKHEPVHDPPDAQRPRLPRQSAQDPFRWARASRDSAKRPAAGLQNSIISIANVVVQSNINQFGAAAMAAAARTAASRASASCPSPASRWR